MNLQPRLRLAVMLAALSGIALASVSPAMAAPSIYGMWVTDDRSAVIRINRCGSKLCGRIVRVLNPKAPKNDVHNPNPARRLKPLVGTRILWGFVPAGNAWKNGRAYDPKSGKSYKSKLAVVRSGKLKVTGCVAFLCRSRYWTRAN